jgi:hypothetical protein
MSLQELSTEDLVKEIQRRKSAEVGELRRQIDEHKKAIRDLEDRIHSRDGEAAPVRRARSTVTALPSGERAERVLTALEGTPGMNVAEISAKVGFEGISLKKTLDDLLSERKVARSGKARGTKYKLA